MSHVMQRQPTQDPASRIARWQRQSGRHGLPWQQTRDPYRIWLSEIMLQQTQAATVIPYYERFLATFPTLRALADAPLDAVLHAWAGLGYYARARNLHRCAQTLRDHHAGEFPETAAALETLPGIGRSTAAAIAAFAYQERAPILDGNVRRVLIRHEALDGDPGTAAFQRTLWQLAQHWLDQAPADLDMRAYTQGQMDLGATLCTRSLPDCHRCPLASDCKAYHQGRQHELPHKRRRQPVPTYESAVLILAQQQRVWLQRRPLQGIWGGLWCLPLFSDRQALADFCDGLPAPQSRAPLASVDHVFTHFRLRLHPVLVQLPPGPTPVPAQAESTTSTTQGGSTNPALITLAAGPLDWIARDQLSELGMPAPIDKLLQGLEALDLAASHPEP